MPLVFYESKAPHVLLGKVFPAGKFYLNYCWKEYNIADIKDWVDIPENKLFLIKGKNSRISFIIKIKNGYMYYQNTLTIHKNELHLTKDTDPIAKAVNRFSEWYTIEPYKM